MIDDVMQKRLREDHKEINFVIEEQDGLIYITFGEEIKMVALTLDGAEAAGKQLIEMAEQTRRASAN